MPYAVVPEFGTLVGGFATPAIAVLKPESDATTSSTPLRLQPESIVTQTWVLVG